MKKKSLLAAAAAFAASAIALTGCSLQGGSPGPTASADTSPIKIGAVLPQSGPYAILGAPQAAALKLEAAKINGEGGIAGRQIELTIQDDTTDPSKGAQLYNQLASTGSYDFMLTSSFTSSTEAQAPSAEQYEIPTLALGPSSALATGKNKWVFVVPGTTNVFAESTFQYMKAQGFKKVAMAYTSGDAYGENGKADSEKWAQSNGIDIVAEEGFDRTATDFSGMIQKFVSSGADSVLFWGSGPAPSIFTQQWSQLGNPKMQLFMTGSQGSDLYIKSKGQFVQATQGVIIAEDMPVDGKELPAGTVLKSMTDAFVAQWATLNDPTYDYPPAFAFEAAAALQIIKAAIEKAGTTDHAKVRDTLESLEVQTVIGVKHYSATDHDGFTADNFAILQVDNGEFKATPYALEQYKNLK